MLLEVVVVFVAKMVGFGRCPTSCIHCSSKKYCTEKIQNAKWRLNEAPKAFQRPTFLLSNFK
jgi:transposase